MKYLSSAISLILLISLQTIPIRNAAITDIVKDALANEDWSLFQKMVDAAEMVQNYFMTLFSRKDFLRSSKQQL